MRNDLEVHGNVVPVAGQALVCKGVARQMRINVTDLFLLACLCDVLSVPLLNQVYRLPPLPPTSPAINARILGF